MKFLWRWIRGYRTRSVPAAQSRIYMRLYPPLFFSDVRPLYISPDYRRVHVRVRYSWLNRNLNNSIYGGSLLCAIDPWYGMLLWQIFARQKRKIEIWVQRVQADFLKPATEDVFFTASVEDTDLQAIETQLAQEGKIVYPFTLEAYTASGVKCLQVTLYMYLRDLDLRPRKKTPVS